MLLSFYSYIPPRTCQMTTNFLFFVCKSHLSVSDQYVELKIMYHEIIKVLMHFGRQMPVFFFYTRPTAAAKIRKALRMEDINGYYYDTTSSGMFFKNIILQCILIFIA